MNLSWLFPRRAPEITGFESRVVHGMGPGTGNQIIGAFDLSGTRSAVLAASLSGFRDEEKPVLMGLVLAWFAEGVHKGRNIAEAMARANARIVSAMPNARVRGIFGLLDTKEKFFQFATPGEGVVFLYKKYSSESGRYTCKGLALGGTDEKSYSDNAQFGEVRVEEGDVLLLPTPDLFRLKKEDKVYQPDWVVQLLGQNGRLGADMDRILAEDVKTFCGSAEADYAAAVLRKE